MIEQLRAYLSDIQESPLAERVEIINALREEIHAVSPFKTEPVDFVKWVTADDVRANDYNPNSVAPPEMELLRHSIREDGYTQPIVAWSGTDKGGVEVVDGFHRHRVGRECDDVRERVHAYLPVVDINTGRTGKGDRIASTIRHNRARGKHKVDAMSDIVIELKRRNWNNARISRELGMDEDEVLRLCQITGLSDIFSNQEFSSSWDVEGFLDESDFEELDDAPESIEGMDKPRTVNTSDPQRIFHTHDKWECYDAGLYAGSVEGKTKTECRQLYADFLRDDERFRAGMQTVIETWKNSCEHYLTNAAMNRIAWMGQAAACVGASLPAEFRGGFNLLSESEQIHANELATEYINTWLTENERPTITLEEAAGMGRQSDIY